MTKDNKFKEKAKIKVLHDISVLDQTIMYTAVNLKGKGATRQDFKNDESLYDAITKNYETENGDGYIFEDREKLTLSIKDHDKLIKRLNDTTYSEMEIAKRVDSLIERLENLESEDTDPALELKTLPVS